MLETLYRHRSTLETIFRIVDTDNSGMKKYTHEIINMKFYPIYLLNAWYNSFRQQTQHRWMSFRIAMLRPSFLFLLGLISFEDFRQTLKLFSAYLKMEISDEVINELVISMDTNNDGSIDIDEFMEAFRLVDKSRLERGKSLLQLRQDIQRLPREEESSQNADSKCPQTSQCPADSACSQTSHSPASQTADCQSSQTDDLCHISVDVPPQ